jgi:hypothetical protein
MLSVIIAALVLVTGLAIAGTTHLTWRVLNLCIILGCTFIGLGIGFVVVDDQNAPAVGISIGVIGALCCSLGNQWRRDGLQ